MKLDCAKRLYEDCCKCLVNTVPKQKVKKKISEAKRNRKYANTAYEYTEEDVWDIVKDNLEELLEEGK